MSRLDADLLLRALVAHEVEFVVIGGLAVVAHGYVRGTKDVDVFIAPSSDNRRRLHAALVSLGGTQADLGDFEPEEMPVPFTPAGLDEGGNWAIDTTAGRIDVFQWVAGVPSWDDLRRSAIEGELAGVGRVLFAGYDEIVAMKRAAGRPEDEVDLQRLRAARGEE